MFDPNQAVGMKVEAAAEWFKGFGYTMRVTRLDEQKGGAIVTRDYRLDRINVDVRNGKIFDVLSVG